MDTATLRKSLARHAAALKKADAALKDAESLKEPLVAAAAYAADDAVRAIESAVRDLEDVGATINALGAERAALEKRAGGALADASGKLAAQIAGALAPEAPVTGQLPELKWGLLRLEFKLAGPKREIVIWYGPKIAKLTSAPLDVEAVAAAARDARASLDRSPLDAAAFIDELRAAYESARRRTGAQPAAPVPLLVVLQDLVVLRQSSAFLADPTRENFHAYSRVQFSYDLYRAGPRGALNLGVAAHAQTKRAEDHLWVPTSPSGDGTHFASLAVRERKDGGANG